MGGVAGMKKERHWVLPAIWAILLMLLLGGVVWAYQAFSVADWQSLDPSRLTSLAQTGAIHDKNGDYVTSLVGKENRTVIDTSRLPAHVVNAFLAAEDLRFYKHPGFDITRIIGAMLTNVRDGAFSQGASTISQQLIKLSHLSSQKTIARKLEEIHLALQLEKQYTKDEILDMYLNFIYFGQGAYGVQAAAEVTFGVDAADLTPAQAASLAAAIKAPSAYSLQSAPESNRERREYILSIMLEENMLTQAEYDAALETPYNAASYASLLNEALGTAKEGEKPLSLTLLVNEDSSFKVAAAQEVAASLTNSRLTVTVEAVPWDTFIARLQNGQFDLYYGECRLTADWDVSALVGAAGGGVAASSYQSEDADILAAEAAYCALEAELQEYLDTYERTHDYDEYHYDLDEIKHDPYVLASILSALHDGAWTASEVRGTLQMLFEKQYILTETVVTEVRYRTVTRTDSEGNEYEVEVPYNYYICTVELENFDLSHLPVYIMDEETLSKYALYMSVLGNKPELFGDSEYIPKYITNRPEGYEIPPSAMEDETFAAVITEAEKYLGYPYVWGGSSPSTSFDCSGFVSWVLTNSGVCNTGRLGAQGLYNISTPVSNPQPGDLVFFVGTYDTPGVSHVGIYVGNSMMIHCGDPISYSNLNSSYWQAHFYAYARPPYN